MLHHAHPPSAFEGAEYLLFKKEVAAPNSKPSFRNGGRWTVRLEATKPHLWNELWQSTALALIGETFADCGGEEILCGAVISVNAGVCRVELWLSEADEEQVLAIGRVQSGLIWETHGLWDKAKQTLTYEDFSKRKVVVQLSGPKASKSTVGIFQ